jgi:hypothetical protein
MGSEFGYGQFTPWDTTHELNVICAIVRTMLARVDTMKLVKVTAVHAGQGGAAGTVDVLPLVNQVDGFGNATPQGTVYGVPWWRLQGGTGAVVCDPVAGDIGYVVCADRDGSNVTRTKKQANPGSFRSFNVADGVYVGGILNAAPAQFVSFTTQGMTWRDANGNTIVSSATGIDLTPKSGEPVTVTGSLVVTQDATVDGNGTVDGNLAVVGALTALTLQIAGGSTIKRVLTGSKTVTATAPNNLVAFTTITVTGAKVGDYPILSNPNMGSGAFAIADVTAPDTVTVFSCNFTGNPATATLNTNVLVIGFT